MTYDTLISPAALMPHLGDDNWRVIDCRFSLANPESGRLDYRIEHIPGALYAHLDDDLSSPIHAGTGRHPLPARESLREKFSTWGIDSTTQVVVYDTSNGTMAARLWWLLRWMGHAAVALLDGGMARWKREENPLSNELPMIKPRQFAAGTPLEQLVSSEELLARLDSQKHLLIDVRAPERFSGEVEPLDRVAGHIPGAVNLPLQNNLDADGSFLPVERLKRVYQTTLAGRPTSNVSVMCGSGVTACHTLLALRVAGLGGASLYAGSWSEWITDPARPVVTRPA